MFCFFFFFHQRGAAGVGVGKGEGGGPGKAHSRGAVSAVSTWEGRPACCVLRFIPAGNRGQRFFTILGVIVLGSGVTRMAGN